MRRNIILDSDNTLVDWSKAMNHELRTISRYLTVSRLNGWPAWIRKIIFSIIYNTNPSFWKDLSPIPDHTVHIFSCIRKALGRANPPAIYVCTKLSGVGNRAEEIRNKKICLRRLFAENNIPLAGIIIVPNEGDKSDYFPEGKNLLVDDYYKNVIDARDAGEDGVVLDKSWGKSEIETYLTPHIMTNCTAN